jgi:acyl-coenzyme A synthetase/AMP-(fatty) acid ligase
MTKEGNFLFMGRIDSGSYQKIRGNCLELLEISNAILKASDRDTAECAVILKGEESPFLVAYVAFANDRFIEAQTEYLLRLKDNLTLPSYIRLAMIFPVAMLPKTANGKVDTKALRSLSHFNQHSPKESDVQLTADENTASKIWNEVIPETY